MDNRKRQHGVALFSHRKFVFFSLVLLNICMKTTAKHVRNFLNEHSQHITHWAVAHTPFHTYKATPQQLDRMKQEAQKQCLFFRRSFSQFLYQAKALRKPHIYSPLLITTIEGVKASPFRQDTIHFNFAIGNIPSSISTDELRQVFEHCWVVKAKLSSKKIWLQDADSSRNTHWLNYITKEAEIGNIDTWDFQNTQIPHVALAAD
jgi:hypothetical protein